jgi:hypothetical protein
VESVVQPLFKRALAGEIVQGNELRLESGEITTYWNIVLAPLTEGSTIIGFLNVAQPNWPDHADSGRGKRPFPIPQSAIANRK